MKKSVVLTVIGVLTFLFIDTVVLDGILDKNVNRVELADVLKEHCDCEVVQTDISTLGLSFKVAGEATLGDSHSFRLSKCKFNDFNEYIEDLHTKIQESIPNFCDANLVELTFTAHSSDDKIVEIRDCVLTIK